MPDEWISRATAASPFGYQPYDAHEVLPTRHAEPPGWARGVACGSAFRDAVYLATTSSTACSTRALAALVAACTLATS